MMVDREKVIVIWLSSSMLLMYRVRVILVRLLIIESIVVLVRNWWRILFWWVLVVMWMLILWVCLCMVMSMMFIMLILFISREIVVIELSISDRVFWVFVLVWIIVVLLVSL